MTPTVRAYGIAAIATAATVIATHHGVTAAPLPLILLLLPIVLATHYSGLGAGLVATIVGVVVTLLIGLGDRVAEGVTAVVLVTVVLAIVALNRSLRVALRGVAASQDRAEQSERRFSESFHASPVPIALLQLASHRFTEVNEAFMRLCGRSREELIGFVASDFGLISMPAAAKLSRRLRRSGMIRNEPTMMRSKDGLLHDVVLALDLVMLDSEPHCLLTVHDRTEQRRIELALHASEQQVRQTQKMDSLGMLAGGIAHDFNNLLAVIAGNASLLSDAIAKSGDHREMIDDIESTVTRAVALTRQLLTFSRKQVTAPVVVDLNILVAETGKMLRRMIGGDVKLETSLEPDLDHVLIDPGCFTQVLVNLVVNARDAMPRGGTISISTRNDGSSVVLSVADTGEGMTPEVRGRVFEPFFTTKEAGRGTGMGLAVVHGIIQQAGGRIDVESVVGGGAAFKMQFPAVTAAVEGPRRQRTTIPHGVETVLVVDDDEHVRRTTARGLRSRGFKVLEASGGTAALRALDSTIDLLLTDVVMPHMDGRELVEIATAAHPHLKILYMSGCVDDLIVRHGVERCEVELIEKPFRSNALAWKVRHVLDSRGTPSCAGE